MPRTSRRPSPKKLLLWLVIGFVAIQFIPYGRSHVNPGVMTRDELALLRTVSASQGIMLETAAARLSQKGMPHHGSPDKLPERRLETIRLAGEGVASSIRVITNWSQELARLMASPAR